MTIKPSKRTLSEFKPVELDEGQVLSLHQMESLVGLYRRYVSRHNPASSELHLAISNGARQLAQAASVIEDDSSPKLSAKQVETAYSMMNHAMEAAAHILGMKEGILPERVLYTIAANAETVLCRADQLAAICEKGATTDAQREQIATVRQVQASYVKSLADLKEERGMGDYDSRAADDKYNSLELPEVVVEGIKKIVSCNRQAAVPVAQLG